MRIIPYILSIFLCFSAVSATEEVSLSLDYEELIHEARYLAVAYCFDDLVSDGELECIIERLKTLIQSSLKDNKVKESLHAFLGICEAISPIFDERLIALSALQKYEVELEVIADEISAHRVKNNP
jgi:hypothetical protein